MKKKLSIIIVLAVIGGLILQKIQYHNKIHSLVSLEPQSIRSFHLYPGQALLWEDPPVEFDISESLIEEFFRSLSDVSSYSPSHDTSQENQRWFLEIHSEKTTIQISCYVPSKRGNVVVGHLGKFSSKGTIDYGYFQSRKLYQWYQKYSHRWLEPEGSQPTPTPPPDQPGGE